MTDGADDDEGGAATPGGVELHPLFVEAEEQAIGEGRAALAQPIETIDVWRFAGNHGGKPAFISWHYAQDLHDETALLEAHGPGWYELRGRNAARNKILRKASLRVGGAAASPTWAGGGGGGNVAGPPAAAPAPAAAAPAHGIGGSDLLALLISEMRSSRDSTTQMMLAFAQSSREGAADMVRAVSSLAASRVSDQQGLINALTAVNRDGGDGMERGAEMYEKVLAQAMAISETLRANGHTSQGGEIEMMNAFVDGIKTLKHDPNSAEAVAAAANAQAAAAAAGVRSPANGGRN